MAEKVLMLALSPTMEEGTIAAWLKKEGDKVASGDVLCEVETDKATMEYETSQEGTLLKIVVAEGGRATVGQLIAIIGKSGEDFSAMLATAPEPAMPQPAQAEVGNPPAAQAVKEAPPVPETDSGRIKASPLARRIAADTGVDLKAVSGSGPGGRIIKRDLENASPAPVQKSAKASAPRELKIPVSQKRKVIAKRLAESKFSAPHYYLKVSIAMEGVLEARRNYNERAKEKVSLNAFLIKLAAEALRKHPAVNASWQGEHILQFGSVDIGLAVAQSDGLITPVVRDCLGRGIVAIDADLKELIAKAQNNKLTPEEYTGATFTISNLGSFGIEEFTAIINPPGSAILAVGETRPVPVADASGSVVVRQIMKVTLSCDHRVIDGATGAAFLSEFKAIVEDPFRALL